MTARGSSAAIGEVGFMGKQGSNRGKGIGCFGAIVAVLLVAILAAGAVYGVALVSSADRAKGLATDARSSYESARSSAQRGDLPAALASARQALGYINELDAELSGPLWDVAQGVPVIGEDVAMTREMVSIVSDLSDEAVLPILDELDVIVDGSALGEGPAEFSGHLTALASAFDRSADVVYACEKRADALPQSHFEQLNEAADELKHAMSAAAGTVRAFEEAVDALGYGVSSLVDGLSR